MSKGGRAGSARSFAAAMIHLALAPGTSFCLVGGEPVFLDLTRDRYFRLGGDAAEGLRLLLSGAPGEELPTDALDRLLNTGLVVASDAARIVPAAAPAAARALVEEEENLAPRSLGLLPELIADMVAVKAALARGGLAGTVERHRAAKRAAREPVPPDRLAELVRLYRTLRPLIPIQPNCLPDSLALASFLRRRGAVPDLVFGVKLAPFGAHCWLQSGDLVLNDRLGNASDFTPILVA